MIFECVYKSDVLNSSTLINIISIFGSAFLAYHFSKKGYTFEKFYDRKLTTIEDIYAEIISLRQDIKKYLYFFDKNLNKDIEERKRELEKVNSNFFKFQNLFWKREIILSTELTNDIQKLIDKYIEITANYSSNIISESIGSSKVSDSLEALRRMDQFEEIQGKLKEEFKKVFEGK